MFASDLPAWSIRALAFVFGALWGSFFNVAIYRWPRDMSVVSPPSHCPACGTPVPAWRNLPILGYLLLRGKAACCGARLTPRYFLVELSSAALCLALAERYVIAAAPGATLAETALTTGLFFAFVGGLLVATFVDLEWLEIPDEVSIGGAALGLATVSLRTPGPDAMDAAIGAGGGFLLVQLLLVWSWERLTGRRGMGEGDSKLLMFIGAFLGWKGALFALVAGAMQGVVVALGMMAAGHRMGPGGAVPESESESESEPESESESESEADSDDEATSEVDGSDVVGSAADSDPVTGGGDGDGPSPQPPPASGRGGTLTLADGLSVTVDDDGKRLEIKDERDRLLWDHDVPDEDVSALRRPIPFGPFLALAALEFLFFGDALIDAYLGLFE